MNGAYCYDIGLRVMLIMLMHTIAWIDMGMNPLFSTFSKT